MIRGEAKVTKAHEVFYEKVPRKHTPSVELRISLKLSSSNNANESSGIRIGVPPKLNQKYNPRKKQSVVKSLGLEKYHVFLLLFAGLKVAPFGDIIPRVSMEMRRIAVDKRET